MGRCFAGGNGSGWFGVTRKRKIKCRAGLERCRPPVGRTAPTVRNFIYLLG